MTKLPVPDYDIGDTVYPRLAPEKGNALLVTGYLFRAGPTFSYLVTDAEGDETERAPFELTDEVGFGGDGE